jgi:MFS family permease
MIGSNIVRLLAVSTLAVLVMTHRARIEHVLALSICFGFAEAFFFPAYTSIVRSLVSVDMLAAANALLTISFQIAMIAGPAIAGIVIGKLGTAPTLWADAATFVVSLSMLVLLRPEAIAKKAGQSMRGSLAEGARFVWSDPVTRGLIFGFSAINFSTFGPFFVGMPVIAKTVFGSATALGMMFGAYGLGALFGGGIAGSVKRTPNVGPLLLSISIAASLAMFGLGVLPKLWQMCSVLFVTGAVVGFGRVFVMALLQGRTQPQMLGRVMSFVMFGSLGTMPISFAVTGFLVQRGTSLMFTIAGISALVLGTAASLNGALWNHAQKAAAPDAGPGATTGSAA